MRDSTKAVIKNKAKETLFYTSLTSVHCLASSHYSAVFSYYKHYLQILAFSSQ